MNFLEFIKKEKAFSLLEMIVSLAIVAIMMVLLTNILVTSIKIATKASARGNVREEISDVLSDIKKDLRNAESITDCNGEDVDATCTVTLVTGTYIWKKCDGEEEISKICRYDISGNVTRQTSDFMTIDSFSFDEGLSASIGQKTILVTIIGSHVTESTNVQDVIQQTAISTRNYTFLESSKVALVYTPVCGDEVANGSEQCDDGNIENGDGCSDSCMLEQICGDGTRQGTEVCDDGNASNYDSCTDICTKTTTYVGYAYCNQLDEEYHAEEVPGYIYLPKGDWKVNWGIFGSDCCDNWRISGPGIYSYGPSYGAASGSTTTTGGGWIYLIASSGDGYTKGWGLAASVVGKPD